jgi:hypothetical protein
LLFLASITDPCDLEGSRRNGGKHSKYREKSRTNSAEKERRIFARELCG